MDFTFSDDQVTFRDSVSRFLMTEAAPEVLRDIWETDRGRSPELRAKLAEQGRPRCRCQVRRPGPRRHRLVP